MQGMAAVAAFYILLGAYAILAPDREQDSLFAAPPRIYAIEGPVLETSSALKPSDFENAPHASHGEPAEKPPSGKGVLEETEFGMIPRKSPEGLTPFEAHRRPFTRQNRPVIAIALMDYGLSKDNSAGALNLPANVTFIANPYAANLDEWQSRAEGKDHELWLYVPTETARFPYMDPGPYGLLAHLDSAANRDRLHWLMAQTRNYAGLAMDADSSLLESRMAIQKIVDEFFDRGLGYMDINKDAPSFFEVAALGRNAPYIRNMAVMGESGDDAAVLNDLERQARASGTALAVVKLHPQSVKVLEKWLPTLASKGIDLAPLSALANHQTDASH